MSDVADILDVVDVRRPCHIEWAAMPGDARVRTCGSCVKQVYNLSAMSKEEARELIVRHEGKICVRFYRRADGTVVTADCSRATVGSRLMQAAAAIVFLAGGVLGFVKLYEKTANAGTGSPKVTLTKWVNSSWNASPP